MENLWTIELNLDDDYASSCSYHVAELLHTIIRNIDHAESNRKTNRWVLVGLAQSHDEAIEKTYELQKLLCERNGRKFKTLDDEYSEEFDE